MEVLPCFVIATLFTVTFLLPETNAAYGNATLANFQKEMNEDLSGFLGNHFIYTYSNGWTYEWYARNRHACDYRIHHGLVGGRWVVNQRMNATKFATNIYRVDWHEPTGTCVSLLFDLHRKIIHGTIFFPQWIGGDGQHPEKTILFQNEFIEQMMRFRNYGPAYPYVVLPEFAYITSMKNEGQNNNQVINKAPGQLPLDYLSRGG